MRDREVVSRRFNTMSLRSEDSARLTAEQAILEDTIERYSNSQSELEPADRRTEGPVREARQRPGAPKWQWIAAKDAAAATSTVPVVATPRAPSPSRPRMESVENAKVTVTETGLSVLTPTRAASL